MIAIRGIFDGKTIKALENIPVSGTSKVIITFLDTIDIEAEEIRKLSSQSDAFDFWENENEDIYQDYLKSK